MALIISIFLLSFCSRYLISKLSSSFFFFFSASHKSERDWGFFVQWFQWISSVCESLFIDLLNGFNRWLWAMLWSSGVSPDRCRFWEILNFPSSFSCFGFNLRWINTNLAVIERFGLCSVLLGLGWGVSKPTLVARFHEFPSLQNEKLKILLLINKVYLKC